MQTSVISAQPDQPSKLRAQAPITRCKHSYQSFYVWCFVLKLLMFVAFINALSPLGQLTYTGEQKSSRNHSFTQRARTATFLSHVFTYLSATSSTSRQYIIQLCQLAASGRFLSDEDIQLISSIFAMQPRCKVTTSGLETNHHYHLKWPVSIRSSCSPAVLCCWFQWQVLIRYLWNPAVFFKDNCWHYINFVILFKLTVKGKQKEFSDFNTISFALLHPHLLY